LSPLWRYLVISGIRIQQPSFGIISERSRQDFADQPFAQQPVFNWESQFDAAEKVPLHPICAGQEYQRLTGILEIINSAVLEKTIDNAPNGDVLTETFDAWAQTANPAHDQIDFYSGLRGGIQRFDHVTLCQRIHFENNAGRQTVLRIFCLLPHQFHHALVQLEWGDKKLSHALKLADAGQQIEKIGGVLTEIRP